MATLLLSAGGQFIGGALGGPLGATIGRALGAMAGSAIDNQLFGEKHQRHHADIALLSSREGEPVPKTYGWSKTSGNIIWATELDRQDAARSGAKATDSNDEGAICANFAIALCEGEVSHFGRLWADGRLMDLRGVNHRFYKGDDAQLPDSLIVAKQGAGDAPAYRGTAYVVFEQLDLTAYGNRIPQISVEVCKTIGDLEKRTKAICVIPGATEFGYDPEPRVRLLGNGEVLSENSHQTVGKSDWEVSIDELQALCPNLKHVALVVSWFGNDLRCANCSVTPRVMGRDREIKDVEWSVAGLTRNQAEICSEVDGGPAYGGTPSDHSIIAAIKDLKVRGLEVTIYPLMMMDIPSDNQLPNPHDQTAHQPAYPWRGRITCDPAIGQAGSADQTVLARTQIDQFIGTCTAADFAQSGGLPIYAGVDEWSYRRFILHTANVAKAAGGVNAFIIGSEMVSLSTVRDQSDAFPFVDHLRAIAADAKQILGAACQLTYAADWSEYHGYQPADAPGDKFFHLDPLWADNNIDAVGIDNYMPLSDWRDFGPNGDFDEHDIIHDVGYLKSNIVGGEGFDWYYASSEDRENQIRTPITDGAHAEPWVWRYKDLVGWWSNAHHNRVGGVRNISPTNWVPQSKPFWLTELGCAAVSLGANEPNAFPDPKSVENRSPYFSAGNQEPSNQRQFLRAHYEHWQHNVEGFDDANNPVSGVDGRRMLDAERTYLWAWDARPFPAFPLRSDVWSDATSHQTGHWATGRFGCATASELIQEIANENELIFSAADASDSFVEGAIVGGTSSLRENVELLLDTDGLIALDQPDGLRVKRIKTNKVKELKETDFCAGQTTIERTHKDKTEDLQRLNVSFLNRLSDYDTTSSHFYRETDEGGVADIRLPLVISNAAAEKIASKQLFAHHHAHKSVQFSLPLSQLELEVGDVIRLPNDSQLYAISAIRDDVRREIVALSLPERGRVNSVAENQSAEPVAVPPAQSVPLVGAATIPSPQHPGHADIYIGAFAKPWPGSVRVESVIGQTIIATPSELGVLVSDLHSAGSTAAWDNSGQIDIRLFNGHLSSASSAAVLNGANRLLVQSHDGTWEEVGFQNAALVAKQTYRLTGLLRGQNGTGFASVGAPTGSAVLLKNQNNWTSTSPIDELSYFAGHEAANTQMPIEGMAEALLPLSPVHLSTRKAEGSTDVHLSWIARTRNSGDEWAYGDNQLEPDIVGYSVQFLAGGETVRQVEVADTHFNYTSAMQIADFGVVADGFEFEVAQISRSIGPGHFAKGAFS